LWDRNDRELDPKERAKKAKFLEALSLARRSKTDLEEALKRSELISDQVRRKTKAVKLRRGRILPRVRDRIPRSLRIYEKGRLVHVEVANSDAASDIGRYWNAIADLTETAKSTALRRLTRIRFKDITGRFHTLERDPKVILELEARKPKPEMFEIYRR
jgi:hypothetical protein